MSWFSSPSSKEVALEFPVRLLGTRIPVFSRNSQQIANSRVWIVLPKSSMKEEGCPGQLESPELSGSQADGFTQEPPAPLPNLDHWF